MTLAGKNPPIEFDLSHDGDNWRASRPGLQVFGRTLEDLEWQLCQRLCSEDGGAGMDVHLQFDMDCLPRWLHQYQAHYFNYVFRVEAA